MKLRLSIGLFVLTFISAMWSQAVDWHDNLLEPFFHPSLLLKGMPFACTLMAILLAHELGHFFTAKRLGIDHSLPYFIPAPTFFGTLGAVITMRSQPYSRSDLFRVALAGPYAGLIVAIPATAWGLAHSLPISRHAAALSDDPMMGSSILFHYLAVLFAPRAEFYDLHQVALAGWVGLFVTSLNLIPASQLDGGHLLYTLFPKTHRKWGMLMAIGLFTLGMMVGLNGGSIWVLWAFLLSIMGLQHPPVQDESIPLSKKQKLHASIALFLLLITFIPVPIRFPEVPPVYKTQERAPIEKPQAQEEEPEEQTKPEEQPEAEPEEFRL